MMALLRIIALLVLSATAAVADGYLTPGTPPTVLPVYDNAGNLKTPSHVVVGQVALTAGSATVTLTGASAYTSSTTYTCTSSDQNVIATLSTIIIASGTSFTVKGSLTDTISYNCMGW